MVGKLNEVEFFLYFSPVYCSITRINLLSYNWTAQWRTAYTTPFRNTRTIFIKYTPVHLKNIHPCTIKSHPCTRTLLVGTRIRTVAAAKKWRILKLISEDYKCDSGIPIVHPCTTAPPDEYETYNIETTIRLMKQLGIQFIPVIIRSILQHRTASALFKKIKKNSRQFI